MNRHFVLLVILFVLGFYSCEKDNNTPSNDIDKYFSQMVDGTYNDPDIPDFEPEHIALLLNYRYDTRMLETFPINPISSWINDSVMVGTIALWTIESIRVSEIAGDSNVYNRYPSLNPCLYDTTDYYAENTLQYLQIAASAYYNWWNSNLSEAEKLEENPLAETALVWR